jgi:hypothetical protein
MRFAKFTFIFSSIILILSIVVVGTAWATKYSLVSGRRFPNKLNQATLQIANLPHTVHELGQVISTGLRPAGKNDPYTKYINTNGIADQSGGYLLIPYLDSNGISRVILLNIAQNTSKEVFRSDQKLNNAEYTDMLPGASGFRHTASSSSRRVSNPYLSKNGRMYYVLPWNDLVCFNTITLKEEWRVGGSFHHSVELDNEGNIWACGALAPGSLLKSNNGILSSQTFEDQAIVKISEQGKIINAISITDLFNESGMEYFLFGCSNPKFVIDPIHLNHVNPVNNNYGKIKKGSLLVSLRNLSTVLLVDPIKRKVDWHQTGPWLNQHCVNPIGDSRISVFDNHAYIFGSDDYGLDSSWETRVLTHNIESNESKVVDLSLGKKSIRIPIEGRAIQISPERWIIEDSVHGTIFIFEHQKMIFKWSNTYPDGKLGYTSWCRFMRAEEIPDYLLKQN